MMERHDEKVEKELVQALRKAKANDDRTEYSRLYDNLQSLFVDDAAEVAARVFPQDEHSRSGLKLFLLSRLASPIRNYDCDQYDSFAAYVVRGWNRFAVRDDGKSHRTSSHVCVGGERKQILSLDASISAEGDGATRGDMIAGSDGVPDDVDALDFYEWLCGRFNAKTQEECEALRDTIAGLAGPVARRLGLTLLSRRLEPGPATSRYLATRYWADVPTRRKFWKELSAPL